MNDQPTALRHPRGGLYFEDFTVGEVVEQHEPFRAISSHW